MAEISALFQGFSVALTPFNMLLMMIGIYVASAVYIAVFMVWLGKYSWTRSLCVGVGVTVAMFLLFEVWFKVPLFKGSLAPLSFLGY